MNEMIIHPGGKTAMRGFVYLLVALSLLAFSPGCEKTKGGTEVARKGSLAPDFTLKNLAGEDVSLSAARGQVVLIEFWATWCPPCRESLPTLEHLYRRFRGKGLTVLSVAVKDNAEDVAAFTEKEGISFEVCIDDDAVSRIYDVRGIPALFILDRDGIIRHQLEGYRPAVDEEIEARIEALL